MRLTPAETLALQFVMRERGRVAGIDVGEELGMSERSGRRILNSLVRKGVLVRSRRGRYQAVERTEVTTKRPEMAGTTYAVSSNAVSEYVLLVDPNGSTTKGAAPPGIGMAVPGKISDGGGNGWDEFDPDDRPKRKKARNLQNHRLVPREEWTMAHVVREFALRAHHAYPERISPSDNRTLLPALNEKTKDRDVTPQQVADAVDAFFDSDEYKIPPKVSPNAAFLRFLNVYLAGRTTEVTGDLVQELQRRNMGRFS